MFYLLSRIDLCVVFDRFAYQFKADFIYPFFCLYC